MAVLNKAAAIFIALLLAVSTETGLYLIPQDNTSPPAAAISNNIDAGLGSPLRLTLRIAPSYGPLDELTAQEITIDPWSVIYSIKPVLDSPDTCIINTISSQRGASSRALFNLLWTNAVDTLNTSDLNDLREWSASVADGDIATLTLSGQIRSRVFTAPYGDTAGPEWFLALCRAMFDAAGDAGVLYQ